MQSCWRKDRKPLIFIVFMESVAMFEFGRLCGAGALLLICLGSRAALAGLARSYGCAARWRGSCSRGLAARAASMCGARRSFRATRVMRLPQRLEASCVVCSGPLGFVISGRAKASA